MIADMIFGALFVVLALIFLLFAWATETFVRDGEPPGRHGRKLLAIAIAFAVAAYFCFADAHVARGAGLAIALLPLHLDRAKICCNSYQAGVVPRWISQGVCRAFLDEDDDGTPIVTFEGTRPDFAGDWLVDLNQLPLDLDPSLGRLPHGFGSAVHSVIFRMMAQIPATKRVDFNGHSMGASNALIAAACWKLAGRPLGRVTAFEPARVGRLGNILAGEDVLITVCGIDPVPLQPFWRNHPVETVVIHALPEFAQSPIGCHDIANVQAAIDAVLRAPERA
jgi:hypothetical protein